MNNETVEDDDMNQTKSELKKVQLYIESFGKSRQGINNKYISQGEKKTQSFRRTLSEPYYSIMLCLYSFVAVTGGLGNLAIILLILW